MATLISGSTGVNKITDGTITNADIASGAAIAGSKLVMPAGSVLQVVNWRSTAYNTATTSTSFVDTGVSITITPSSTSSKILVVANLNGLYKYSANNIVSTKLLRDSTDIGTIDSMNTYTDTTAHSVAGVSISYLDSPNTSSAVTYKIQFKSADGSNVMINARWNSSNTTHSTMTLMEIAG
mgnify:CR=1 FL=1|tara:strand:+ start:10 stop:552 length:543 start_codon:yes stop_codon:yes gene_type:complete